MSRQKKTHNKNTKLQMNQKPQHKTRHLESEREKV